MSLEDRLEAEISDITALVGTTSPALELDVVVRTNSNNSYIVDDLYAESAFGVSEQSRQINGPTAYVNTVKVEEFQKRGATHVPVLLELDQDDLENLENLRDGGNIEVKLEFWMKGRSGKDKDFETGRFSLTSDLLAAQWTDHLDTMNYHNGRSFHIDLETPDAMVRDTIRTVDANIREAERKHDQGDYPGAVVECRRAVETLRTLDDNLNGLFDDRKRSDFDELMGVMETKFLGGLAHSEDMTRIARPLRRDSDFALGITKTCARYAAIILDEELDRD